MYDSKIDTLNHKDKVKKYMHMIGWEMIERGFDHDNSKLESPEKEIFDEYSPKLSNTTYGSDEYKKYLKEMEVALNHHYENNDHHPEYFALRYKNRSTGKPYFKGLSGMNLLQLTEMITDWYASSQRHEDGDIFKSIEINQERFGYSDEIKLILINTINYLQEKEKNIKKNE